MIPAILIIGVLCVIYTVMGGIEAVVWTDAIQALVLMVGVGVFVYYQFVRPPLLRTALDLR